MTLGYFENPLFAKSTNEIAQYLAESGKTVIIGGGDTEEAILPWKDKSRTYLQAEEQSLESYQEKELPAIRLERGMEIEPSMA